MVFLQSWDEFEAKASALLAANPSGTRYTFKYVQNELIVKCTDNAVCLKYKTDEAHDLKRVLAFNQHFFSAVTGGDGN